MVLCPKAPSGPTCTSATDLSVDPQASQVPDVLDPARSARHRGVLVLRGEIFARRARSDSPVAPGAQKPQPAGRSQIQHRFAPGVRAVLGAEVLDASPPGQEQDQNFRYEDFSQDNPGFLEDLFDYMQVTMAQR